MIITPQQFIDKWALSKLKESAAAHEHFIDLCHLLNHETPAQADPEGTWFTFEYGALKTTGSKGYADVWKKGYFGWEYKGKHKDLTAAYAQLQQYAPALANPPLLIVCDTDRFVIHTNWNDYVSEKYEILLSDLTNPDQLNLIRYAFTDPEKLKPAKSRQTLTEEAAAKFASLANTLRTRDGYSPELVAHFINRLIFCMFAEDAELLPNKMFSRMLNAAKSKPEVFPENASMLFKAMQTGGTVGFENVEWFNGGLFDNDTALCLTKEDIQLCIEAANLDWSEVDPSIFGTLFVRGLDPTKRSETGSEYTDREKIMMVIEPIIREPLLREWRGVHSKIIESVLPAEQDLRLALSEASDFSELAEEVRHVQGRIAGRPQMELFTSLPKQKRVKTIDNIRSKLRAAEKNLSDVKAVGESLYKQYLAKLRAIKVLDPACGSGNFLYLALVELKNIERQVLIEAEQLGFDSAFPAIGPESLLGIELNPYAAELARVSVWIGEIQWMRRNGFDVGRLPILKPLKNIECRNAIVNEDGSKSAWPKADLIVGNPPYLGAKLMKRRLGVKETTKIRELYDGCLPGFTDLVCYWFENARHMIELGITQRVGFVATNSIRKNTNLPVLQRISMTTRIFNAWPEQPWTVDGANVDVSIICYGNDGQAIATIDGLEVDYINPDLTTGLNLTTAKVQKENRGVAFLGIQKSGPFDIPGSMARQWMGLPANPNGRLNKEVLKPYWNGDDIGGRPRDMWFIDLPLNLSRAEASLFEAPFNHIRDTEDEDGKTVQQLREELGERAGPRWWEPHWPRPEMRSRIKELSRYIVTQETSTHRLFAWLKYPNLPDKNLIVITKDDDVTFGILHSRFHREWSLRKGSDLGHAPRYTHTSTFSTFPFPDGMTPDLSFDDIYKLPIAQKIANAAKQLVTLRDGWLYPTDLIKTDSLDGFPDRIVPINEQAARLLSGRTLTALYNERPEWLNMAHQELDDAVASAYGWKADIEPNDFLAALLKINEFRAA